VRENSLSGRRAAGSFERLLLPHVPEGIWGAVHGFRSLSYASRAVVEAARHICELECCRARVLPRLRDAALISPSWGTEYQLDDQQPG
jgi:hypothetical protein